MSVDVTMTSPIGKTTVAIDFHTTKRVVLNGVEIRGGLECIQLGESGVRHLVAAAYRDKGLEEPASSAAISQHARALYRAIVEQNAWNHGHFAGFNKGAQVEWELEGVNRKKVAISLVKKLDDLLPDEVSASDMRKLLKSLIWAWAGE